VYGIAYFGYLEWADRSGRQARVGKGVEDLLVHCFWHLRGVGLEYTLHIIVYALITAIIQ
jgi:hypothetical protein